MEYVGLPNHLRILKKNNKINSKRHKEQVEGGQNGGDEFKDEQPHVGVAV